MIMFLGHRQYACIVFMAIHRLETSKKRLVHFTCSSQKVTVGTDLNCILIPHGWYRKLIRMCSPISVWFKMLEELESQYNYYTCTSIKININKNVFNV